jgi:putative transposase
MHQNIPEPRSGRNKDRGFPLSYSGVDSIKMYIINQKKRHEKISFIDEYKALLEEYGIPYDERYI